MVLTAGLILLLVSSVPEVRFLETVWFTETVGPGATKLVSLDLSGFTYVEGSFGGAYTCGLRVYLLDDEGTASYNASGGLPDPDSSLNCDRTRGIFLNEIASVVFENTRNGTEAPSVRLDLFRISQPFAILVFPALIFSFSGASVVLFRLFRGGLVRIVTDLGQREDPDPSRFGREGGSEDEGYSSSGERSKK